MKRFLFSAALLMAGFAAQAQITLENTYPGSVSAFKLSTGEVKYAGWFITENQIRVYNQDHTLLRMVPTPPVVVTSGATVDIEVVSDKLFDNDAGLEFLILMSNGGTYQTIVLNEDGSQLLNVSNSGFAEVFNTPAGAKLFVYGDGSTTFTRVYSLPGTHTVLKAKGNQEAELTGAYPNPTSEVVNLPYSVKAGQTATIEVLDLTGRVVSTHQVDNTFQNLALNTNRLRSGAYLYRVIDATGAATPGRRFVVAH